MARKGQLLDSVQTNCLHYQIIDVPRGLVILLRSAGVIAPVEEREFGCLEREPSSFWATRWRSAREVLTSKIFWKKFRFCGLFFDS